MSETSEDSDNPRHLDDPIQSSARRGHSHASQHSDSHSHSQSHSEPNSNSDSDSDDEPKLMMSRFLDIEAEEDQSSHDSGDDSDESGSEGSLDGFVNDLEPTESQELHFFPQFKRLPLEIRMRIWEFFCPDLLAKGRVYQFMGCDSPSQDFMPIVPGVHLRELTEAARTVLAVHQQSRSIALRAFPNTLPFSEGVVRFDKEKDVVLLDCQSVARGVKPLDPVSSKQVQNIALQCHAEDWDEARGRLERDIVALTNFRDFDNIYFACESYLWSNARHIGWCGMKTHHHYRAETFEVEPGLGEDLEYIYTWPNLDNHPDFLSPWKDIIADETDSYEWVDVSEDDGDDDALAGSPVDKTFRPLLQVIQPMVEFSFDSGLRRFENLVRMADSGTLDEYVISEEESEGDGEPDEYESSGIDDSEIEEEEEHSQDDDDLLVVDDDPKDDQSDGGDSNFAGFSPLRQSTDSPRNSVPRETIDLTRDVGGAQFSSPEPEDDDSETARESDSDDEPMSRPRARVSRSRNRIIDSDDEDGAVDSENVDEPPRIQKRKRAVVSDDDENEDVDSDEDAGPRKRSRIGTAAGTQRRGYNLIIEDDDDSEEEDSKMRENMHRSRAILSGFDDGSESEEEEEQDEEIEDHRPLSLMERLELHRRHNPTPGASDEEDRSEDPDIEEMGEDDYDVGNYNNFEDDDERMEPCSDGDMDDGDQIDFENGGYDDEEEGY